MPPSDLLRPDDATLADELKRAAAEAPDTPFIRTMNGQWSFARVDTESERLAGGLAALGVRPRDRVSLLLPNRIEFVLLWFALAKLGAVAAPVNTAFRGASLVDAIALVGSRVLLADASLRAQWADACAQLPALEHVVVVDAGTNSPGGRPDDSLDGSSADSSADSLAYTPAVAPAHRPRLRATVSRYDDLRRPDGAAPRQAPSVMGTDLCLLLYTSGTTGQSKAAMLSHRFVLLQAAGVVEGLGLRRDDVLYCPYPLFHLDASVMTVAPALLLRATAAIGERFSVSRYWDEMRALQATVFDFMGATLTMLWKQPPSPRDRDHRARLGWGVPLPDWAPRFEQRFGVRLVELYGSTEVGAILYTPLDEPRRPGSCGKPLRYWRVRLVDEYGAEVPVGVVGELLVQAVVPGAIMSGYHGMPEATRHAFADGWFRTGDLLRADADGFFSFVGRRKDVVRRRGENIASAEVEAALEAHADVLQAAVFGVPSELTEDEVMACVVRRAGSTLDAPALAAHAAAALPRFMVPRYIRFVETLPRTPTDKVEKFRLQQQGVSGDTWDREAAAPRDASASTPPAPPSRKASTR